MELLVALTFFGAIFFGYGLFLFGRFVRTKNWLSTELEVADSLIKEVLEPEQFGARRYYVPSFHYNYKVEGSVYEGNKISIDKRGLYYSKKSDAEMKMDDILKS